MDKPRSAVLRAFNVGFGDCFLLSFNYAKDEARHVLIDFGSTRLPPGASPGHMEVIAEKIKELTKGKLHVVVATHRHKDHISGFATGTAKKKLSGDIIRALKPGVVLQPWTEEPDLDTKATGPMAFTKTLRSMNGFSAQVFEFAKGMTETRMEALGYTPREREFLQFAGENNIANVSAVKNLMDMGLQKPRYLHAGNKLDLSTLLPGVSIDVMGPPTVDQHAAVAKQAEKNSEEYWHLLEAGGSDIAPAAPLFPGQVAKPPLHARWIANRLADLLKDDLLGIVRELDKAMNNTSLILLFRAGGKSLLFPGDAQWENWQYALSKPEYEKLLKDVDLYKVGHHGSLNATPKSLWGLFSKKSEKETDKNRLISVMSTLHGVHGDSVKTAVPRATLVDELTGHSHLHSTEVLKLNELYDEITIVL